MSRLKLIGAALLLVIFDMYTASADSRGAQPAMVQFDPALSIGLETPAASEHRVIR